MVSNNAEDSIDTVQWPAFSRPRHRAVRQMVLAVLPDARDLEEMMAERGRGVDHSTIGRWVLRYASELHKQVRHHTRNPNRSWKGDLSQIGLIADLGVLSTCPECP
jgi:hypothetical protein